MHLSLVRQISLSHLSSSRTINDVFIHFPEISIRNRMSLVWESSKVFVSELQGRSNRCTNNMMSWGRTLLFMNGSYVIYNLRNIQYFFDLNSLISCVSLTSSPPLDLNTTSSQLGSSRQTSTRLDQEYTPPPHVPSAGRNQIPSPSQSCISTAHPPPTLHQDPHSRNRLHYHPLPCSP